MRIVILAVGTRGDVQPYVALGLGLHAAGHPVRLATMPSFEGFVRARGLDFAPLRAEFLALLQTPAGKAAVAGNGASLSLLRTVFPMLRAMLDDAWAAAAGADLVIYHPKALAGHAIAEKLQVPGILALPSPLYSPTRAFPSPILPVANLGGTLNRLSHGLMLRLATASTRGLVNRWRRATLGLPRAGDERMLHGQPVLRLYCYSPTVVPPPDDWDRFSVATGYWFLEREPAWQPPAALARFLADGPPPIYIGFGSMPTQDAAAKTQLVLEAVTRTRQRAVLATGAGGLAQTELPPSMLLLDAAPHDWLFPRMAAVVHHGGAGTTGAGLRAGKPTLICPFFGDQPFWGRRVVALGAGPRPIPQRRLSAERLADALTTLAEDSAMRQRAEALGEALRAEDGVANAVKLIQAHASGNLGDAGV